MIATVMLGWLVMGMVAGTFARETVFREVAVDRSQLALLGAIGAWAGGSVAFFCRLSLRPDDPGHWGLALLGSAVLLAFRFLELKPRTIS
jgi:uncharacterized membrane protein YeaQ/YmgE (transglycosylase-associated protein family)